MLRPPGLLFRHGPRAEAPRLLDRALCRVADGPPERALPHDLEVVEQVGELGRHLLAINHGDRGAQVPLPGAGMELLTGLLVEGVLEVPAGAVRVVHL